MIPIDVNVAVKAAISAQNVSEVRSERVHSANISISNTAIGIKYHMCATSMHHSTADMAHSNADVK